MVLFDCVDTTMEEFLDKSRWLWFKFSVCIEAAELAAGDSPLSPAYVVVPVEKGSLPRDSSIILQPRVPNA